MSEAVYGLVGVLIGSAISWGKDYWKYSADNKASAQYLAIRVICVLDKYIEDCVSTVKDDGLSYGQRTEEGYLFPQVKSSGMPMFPLDIDWKSIDCNLMYELLSLPSDVEAADRGISFTWEYASPPDFDEFFEERAYHYAQFGLKVHSLAQKLRNTYGIPAKDYAEWNPISELEQELNKIKIRRQK